MNHRSSVEIQDGVKTEELMLLQDKFGGNLFTGQMAPGIEVA
jgi:hypothetical protein